MDGVGKVGKVERQHVRVGKAHDHGAAGLGERLSIDKVRVGKVRIPVEVVVDGMVDSALVLATVADVKGGNSKMVEKRCVVAARTQRPNAKVAAAAQFAPVYLTLP